MANDNLGRLHSDLLAKIMARVDGPTLAAAACTCSDLRGVAHEEKLWQDLCHATWPSTQEEGAQTLISSLGGFSNFYADSYPLIVYKRDLPGPQGPIQSTHLAPSHLVSLVDVYYKKKCIFSKILHGIDEFHDENDVAHHGDWFLDCPFRLDALNYQNVSSTHDDDEDADYDENDGNDHVDTMGTLPSVPFSEKKETGCGKLCEKLEKNVRLSWVILDTKSGKAVNLSSWKPVSVQCHWPSDGDFLIQFGCVLPVGEQVLPGGSAECVISVRCRLLEREGCLRWTEVNMQVEDKEGAHVSGRSGMTVLEWALGSSVRSKHRSEFDKRYAEYVKEKKEVREKKMKCEGLVDRLCVLSGIGMFAAFCFLWF